MAVSQSRFGLTAQGREVLLFTLTNAQGLLAKVSSFGATLVALEVPGRDGEPADIVLGHDSLKGYEEIGGYFGSTVGRFANRIAGGKFSLEGVDHVLARNNGSNHLHGGNVGFDKVLWGVFVPECRDGEAVQFEYLSPDGEEGYPGNLRCTVTFTLTNENELRIGYRAETDRATPINLTNHSFFNLTGKPSTSILCHVLTLKARAYTPVDEHLIPSGEIAPVEGSPMDFTAPAAMGERLGRVPGGYDHNYVLGAPQDTPRLAARVVEPLTGRVMEISTTQPGIQFYTGNFLDGSVAGKGNTVYAKHCGFCLETQHYPDSPNQSAFPSTILAPGDVYEEVTVHRFFSA